MSGRGFRVFAMALGFCLFSVPLFGSTKVVMPTRGDYAGIGLSFNRPMTRVVFLRQTSGKFAAQDSSIRIANMRVKNDGRIRIKAHGDDHWVFIYATDFDIFPVEIDSVDLDSTTADTLQFFGWDR